MNEQLFNPTFWHWLVLACVFFGLELLVPGVFFLWLGFAAAGSALVKFLIPELSWGLQLLLFSAFSIASLIAWKRFAKDRGPEDTDQPQLNRRNQGYNGRVLVLSESIVNGYGKVRVDDSQWKVSGVDTKIGRKVRVVRVEGSLLHVEPAD